MCHTSVKPFLGGGDGGNKAQQSTIRVRFKCRPRVIVFPDSCERQRQRGHNRRFHPLAGEGRAETHTSADR